MIHQQQELWETESAVFDHDGRTMTCYYMRMNHRTTPVVGIIDEFTFNDVKVPDPDMFADRDDPDDEESPGEEGKIRDEEEALEAAVDEMDEALREVMHGFLIGLSSG